MNESQRAVIGFTQLHPIAPDIRHGLEQLYSLRQRDWRMEWDLAVETYKRYLARLTFPAALNAYFNLVYSLVVSTEKAAKRSKSSNRIYDTLCWHICSLLAYDRAFEVSDAVLEKIWDAAQTQAASEEVILRTTAPHAESFYGNVRASQALRRWISRLKETLPEISSREAREIRQSTDQVWRQVRSERGYGIKNCYFASPLFLEANEVVNVLDERLGIEDEHFLARLPPSILAFLTLGNRPREIQTATLRETLAERDIGLSNRSITMEGVDRIYWMDTSGELHFGVYYTPLRFLFEREESGSAYELFRLFMVMRLHDLTKRADIVESLPSIDRVECGWIEGEGTTGNRRLNYSILLAPRQKPTSSPTGQGGRRFVDRHKVAWFTRPLPSGYRVSDRAATYALEHEVELLPGETIVREHYRGGGRQSTRPTKAKFRE